MLLGPLVCWGLAKLSLFTSCPGAEHSTAGSVTSTALPSPASCTLQVSQLLQRLDPSSAPYRVDLLTRQYAQLKEGLLALLPGAATTHEPWFDMEALAGPLPQETCDAWGAQQPALDMRLPPPNPYVATDFSLRELEELPPQQQQLAGAAVAPAEPPPGVTPVLAGPPAVILDAPGLRLWYKADAAFRTPRTNAFFRLWSPALHASARAAALSHLLLKLLEDALNEDAYLADVAGLHYHTSPEGQAGVELRVDGFSHKHAAFVQRLFGALVALDPARPSFAAVKEALVRRYGNANMQVRWRGGAGAQAGGAAGRRAGGQAGRRAGGQAGRRAKARRGAARRASGGGPSGRRTCRRRDAAHVPLRCCTSSSLPAVAPRLRRRCPSTPTTCGCTRCARACGTQTWCWSSCSSCSLQTWPPSSPRCCSSATWSACCTATSRRPRRASSRLRCRRCWGRAAACRRRSACATAASCWSRAPRRCTRSPPRTRRRPTPRWRSTTRWARRGLLGAAWAGGWPRSVVSWRGAAGTHPWRYSLGFCLGWACWRGLGRARPPARQLMQPAALLQVGPASGVRQRALLDLADQLLYEPCYDTLRTKEQLGYTVSSGSRLTHGVLGFCVVVVSAKYGAQVGRGPRVAALRCAEQAFVA
jgi:hypothetical protein